MNTHRLVMMMAFGLCLVTVLCGCGGEKAPEKVAEKIVEKGLSQEGQRADVKIDKNAETVSMTITDESDAQKTTTMNMQQDGMTMTIKDGDEVAHVQSGAGTAIPDAFPKDVPLYPGMKVEMAFNMGDENFSVSAATSDNLDQVVEYYKKASADNGWTEVMNMAQGGEEINRMISYEKDNRTFMIAATSEEGQVRIAISTGMQ